MKEITKNHWTAMNGRLMFEFTHDHQATRILVNIFLIDIPGEVHVVEVLDGQNAEFNAKFSADCTVFGSFRLIRGLEIDGQNHIGVYGALHYGQLGQFEERHYEGIMVTFAT